MATDLERPKAAPKRAAPAIFRRIAWQTLWLEGRELLAAHAAEFEIRDLERYIGPQHMLMETERAGDLVIAGAYQGGQIVGYVAWELGLHGGLPGARVAREVVWYVKPELRGCGLAKALMSWSLGACREAGATHSLTSLPWHRRRRRRPSALLGIPFEMTWLREL